MIIPFATLVGALLGWFRAHRARGNRLDKLQYAAVFAIIFFVASLILNAVLTSVLAV